MNSVAVGAARGLIVRGLANGPASRNTEYPNSSCNSGTAGFLCLMEYVGVRYELMQTTNPSGWKWIAHVGERQPAGFSSSRDLAIHAAKRAIEKALRDAGENRKGKPPKP